jgi:hypothetical protein
MVFPGVLRGRPGPRLATIHTSQPRRSLSSPWMCTCHSVASYSRAGPARERRCFGEHRSGHQFGRPTVSHPEAASPRTRARHRRARHGAHRHGVRAPRLTKSTRSRAALRNLSPVGPKAFRRLVARPHTSVASLFAARGSASSSNVRLSPSSVKRVLALSPHIPKKAFATIRGRLIRRRL